MMNWKGAPTDRRPSLLFKAPTGVPLTNNDFFQEPESSNEGDLGEYEDSQSLKPNQGDNVSKRSQSVKSGGQQSEEHKNAYGQSEPKSHIRAPSTGGLSNPKVVEYS